MWAGAEQPQPVRPRPEAHAAEPAAQRASETATTHSAERTSQDKSIEDGETSQPNGAAPAYGPAAAPPARTVDFGYVALVSMIGVLNFGLGFGLRHTLHRWTASD
jgi:hypothetical protein